MTDVTTTQDTAIANVEDLNAWGDQPTVDSKDIILPRVYLMQAISKLVEEEKAKVGEMVNSISEEVLGDTENPFEFVPFKIEKLWFVSKDDEFYSIVPVTPENINRAQEEVIEGATYKYQYALRAYVLAEGEPLPLAITFKSTSLRAGKQLFTEMFVKNKMAGKNPAARKMCLTSRKEKNDKGTFYVFVLKAGEDSSVEMQKEALTWVQTLRQGNYKVEETEEPVSTESSDY